MDWFISQMCYARCIKKCRFFQDFFFQMSKCFRTKLNKQEFETLLYYIIIIKLIKASLSFLRKESKHFIEANNITLFPFPVKYFLLITMFCRERYNIRRYIIDIKQRNILYRLTFLEFVKVWGVIYSYRCFIIMYRPFTKKYSRNI